jgi:hypothetical protein
MIFKNMTVPKFLILSLVVINGCISSAIIFSDIGESIKFTGIVIMFVISALIIILGAYYFARK